MPSLEREQARLVNAPVVYKRWMVMSVREELVPRATFSTISLHQTIN